MSAERGDFGARLRSAREARGISLKDIAAATKISVLVLEALERNDASRLPGGLFSRALVRSYAKEVGLDPEQTVREFTDRFGDASDGAGGDERARKRAVTIGEPGGVSNGVRWLGLAVTIFLVIIWIAADRYFSQRAEAPPAPQRARMETGAPPVPKAPALPKLEPQGPPPAPALPAEGSPSGTALSVTPVTPAAGSAPPPPGTQAAAGAQAQAGTIAPTAGQSAAQTPPPNAGQPGAPASPAKPPANVALRVVVTATAPCWVSARIDDERVAGRTLQPGETLELAAARVIVLTTGNAAGVTYTVNDSPGRALGAAGEVKTVVITTANYRTFIGGI